MTHHHAQLSLQYIGITSIETVLEKFETANQSTLREVKDWDTHFRVLLWQIFTAWITVVQHDMDTYFHNEIEKLSFKLQN